MPDTREMKFTPDMSDTWTIWVSGYGTFDFDGTEAEANERRIAKAQHEGGASRMFRKTNQRESDRLMQKVVELWDCGEGVPQSLLKKISEAKRSENASAQP